MSDAPANPALGELIEQRDAGGCSAWLDSNTGLAAVRGLSRLSDEQREELLRLLSPEDAAEVIDQLPESQALDAIEELEPETAARIIEELPSDYQADLIGELETEEAEAILCQLEREDADELRRLAAYEDDVVGGIMITEYLSYPETTTVGGVLEDLEKNAETYADYNIQYAYVVSDHERLVGVLPLRNLLLSPRGRPLTAVMRADPVCVGDLMPIRELGGVFTEHPFMGLPVVDVQQRLVGVVQRSDLASAMTEDADRTYRQSQGIIGGEELRSMPLHIRSYRRLMWLSLNIVLNVIAASVIAFYQETLEAVIALAVFLPIISDMSGCSGNQAVAVSMRELTLGVTRPIDLLRVLLKEASVGLINGFALGVLIAGVAYVWKGNPTLGIVVGAALMLNTLVAVLIGGAIPLILKGMRLDPALASGPILTTITDMCGFYFVLSFASLALSQLT